MGCISTASRTGSSHKRRGVRSIVLHGGAGSAQILLKLPFAAAAGLTRYNQIEAWHEGDELAAGTGFFARIRGNACAAAPAFGPMPRGQFPAVGEDLRVKLPPHFGSFDIVGRSGGLIYKPLRDDLLVLPKSAAKHAISDAGQIARGHADSVRRVTSDLLTAVVI